MFNTSSLWVKIALICLLVGVLLFVIGFSSNSWIDIGGSRFGLWKYYGCGVFNNRYIGCRGYKITTLFLDVHDWTAWYRATQAFECLGLIFVLLALIIILLYICMESYRIYSLQNGVIVCSFVAAASMVIGFVIFGTQIDDHYGTHDVGWSMGLAIAGCICTIIAGVLMLVDQNCGPRFFVTGATGAHTTTRVTTTRHITVRS